ncbi:Domain of Unknown Function (DUF1539) [Chlamydia poikilotherma]|uniref:Uncharacterized protein n=1 Tax=Chlamydia poikilotherma TaxID=1967783 RepID=A0A3B0PWM9_9CHLA|nr:DUF1539 domain-containing protein [Chlamydia poikilotherma]SYX09266.1 Domain of Unknown Function (DUF1539) [Chlamydia poikilotherma]
MSLEHNNFRAAFAPPQPASALHETSFIKTANQKISFRSIFNALSTKLGSCLCLNPEFRSGAGWVFTFVLSAIITVLLCILLLPIKLILLGLSCCPCASRPAVRGEEIPVIPQLPQPTPPPSRRGSDSGISIGLDSSRFAPESFAPIRPQSQVRRPSVDQASIPSQPSIQPNGIVSQDITLRQYLQMNYPEIDLSDITLENLGINFLQAEDLPEETNILDLPASMFFPEGAPNLDQLPIFLSQQDETSASVVSPQPSIIPSQPASVALPADQTIPQQQDISSQPASLVVDTSAAAVFLQQEVDQTLTARDFLNRAYPNANHSVLIHGARVNVRLQGIAVGENDEDILNLPALIAFPDLVAGQPIRPTSLNLFDEPRALSPQQEEPAPPPPTAEELMSPNDPRYIFLQNNFPNLEHEYYNQHINLLASLAGIDAQNLDLLQLPLEVFVATPARAPDYEPISMEDAALRLQNSMTSSQDLTPEEVAERNNKFTNYLIENSPRRWTFLNRLKNNIISTTISLDLRRDWFIMLDTIANKTLPELATEEFQQRAQGYLFKINTLLKNNDLSPERKKEMLKYIISHKSSSPEIWLEAMHQELLLQESLQPGTVITTQEANEDTDEAEGTLINRVMPPCNTQASAEEIAGYTQLLRHQFSRPVFINQDSIHLAPTNDEYLQTLTSNSPNNWGPIKVPLGNKIKELTQNYSIRRAWTKILSELPNGAGGMVSSEDAQTLARGTMFQILKLLNNEAIPTDRKLSIITVIASFSDRCGPTWVRVAGQELQNIFNSNNLSTNVILSWVQICKEHLLSEVFNNEAQWHMMTAFKEVHGSELGLDNTGIILDGYTMSLARDFRSGYHAQYLNRFRNRYIQMGEQVVESALTQALTGSDDQVNTLQGIVLADLEAAGVPESERANIMMDVFFTEENEYKPTREVICYLLLKAGVITHLNNNN